MSQSPETTVATQLVTEHLRVEVTVHDVVYDGRRTISIQKADAEHRWEFHISCVSVPARALVPGEFRITGISVFSKPEKQPEDRMPIGPGHLFSGFCVSPGDYGSRQSLRLTLDRERWPAKAEDYYYTIDALWNEAPPTLRTSWDPTMHIEAGGPPGLWARFLRWLRRLFS